MDSNDYAHMAYVNTNDELRYVYFDGSTGITEAGFVDTTQISYVDHISLGLDKQDRAYISFEGQDNTGSHLYLAYVS